MPPSYFFPSSTVEEEKQDSPENSAAVTETQESMAEVGTTSSSSDFALVEERSNSPISTTQEDSQEAQNVDDTGNLPEFSEIKYDAINDILPVDSSELPPPPSVIMEANPIQQPPRSPDTIITLQVCDHRFFTKLSTLTNGSIYFSTYFSNANTVNNNDSEFFNFINNPPQPQNDGSYFIDANPDLFKHILNFLRRGVFPVFYSKSKGHDYGTYASLLGESRHFHIPRLIEWLESKSYERTIRTSRNEFRETCGPTDFIATSSLSNDIWSNQDLEWQAQWVPEKTYLCPRRIAVHKGRPEYCGRACAKAKSDWADEYEHNVVLRTMVVEKNTHFDNFYCETGMVPWVW